MATFDSDQLTVGYLWFETLEGLLACFVALDTIQISEICVSLVRLPALRSCLLFSQRFPALS